MSTIINFCPTGMIPVKKMTPHVPVTPQEIIEQVHEAYEIGITIVHLHAREEDETPTFKKSAYQEMFEGVKAHCPGLIICGSTSGRNFPEFDKRSEVIELRPDMCSLTLSSLNFWQSASLNAPDMIQQLANKMNDYGVKPELECFDLGMINYGKYLISKNILKGPFYWNLLFGNIAGFQHDFSHIGTALDGLQSEEHYIALGGLGESQLKVNAMAIASGYGIRIGLEDNIWFDKNKKQKATNIGLLKRAHQLMDIHETTLMASVEFGKKGFYNEQH